MPAAGGHQRREEEQDEREGAASDGTIASRRGRSTSRHRPRVARTGPRPVRSGRRQRRRRDARRRPARGASTVGRRQAAGHARASRSGPACETSTVGVPVRARSRQAAWMRSRERLRPLAVGPVDGRLAAGQRGRRAPARWPRARRTSVPRRPRSRPRASGRRRSTVDVAGRLGDGLGGLARARAADSRRCGCPAGSVGARSAASRAAAARPGASRGGSLRPQ